MRILLEGRRIWFQGIRRLFRTDIRNRSGEGSATSSSSNERMATVASFYNQSEIDKFASQPSVRLTPSTIMYSGKSSDGHHILRSAQYLQRELPIRLANLIAGLRSLPFIVGCNPIMLQIHELYIRSFHLLSRVSPIETVQDEEEFSSLLRRLMDDHKDVIALLAEGFRMSRKHIKDETTITKFLDNNLVSRLSIRMLATHHLHLKDNVEDHIGIVNINLSLKNLVERWATIISDVTQEKYGVCPNIRISGHVSARFPYMEMPLDYIIPELLKNALRAVIETHSNSKGMTLPPVIVTIANDETDFAIRISDRGGGIPPEKKDRIMCYNFSSAEMSTDAAIQQSGNLFDGFLDTMNRSTSGPMHGYGFGLPVSRAYAECLGGSLTLESLPDLGTDVYLRLKHFNSKENSNSFRI